VILFNPDYGPIGPDATSTYHGLRSVADRLTPIGFAPPGQSTAYRDRSGKFHYDHSPAGIEAGARKLATRARTLHLKHGVRALWVDIESFSSVNVPSHVDYLEARDRYHATTYDLAARRVLRQEVARFRMALVGRAAEIVRTSAGDGVEPLPSYEFLDYNCPRKLNRRERNYTFEAPEIAEEVEILRDYVEFLDGCGPQTQFLVDAATINALPEEYTPGGAWDEMIEWLVNGCRCRIRAYGPHARVTSAIWPVLYSTGGFVSSWPTPTRIVPAGVMSRLLNELNAAGVTRFVLYWARGSLEWNSEQTRNDWNARWEEVAAWIVAQSNVQVVA